MVDHKERKSLVRQEIYLAAILLVSVSIVAVQYIRIANLQKQPIERHRQALSCQESSTVSSM